MLCAEASAGPSNRGPTRKRGSRSGWGGVIPRTREVNMRRRSNRSRCNEANQGGATGTCDWIDAANTEIGTYLRNLYGDAYWEADCDHYRASALSPETDTAGDADGRGGFGSPCPPVTANMNAAQPIDPNRLTRWRRSRASWIFTSIPHTGYRTPSFGAPGLVRAEVGRASWVRTCCGT